MLRKLRFDGAPVIVTGAGSGIGRACCEVFAELGATVILAGRTEATLRETQALLGGVESECHVVDVSQEDQIAAFRESLSARWDFVKAVVNNAGTNFVSRITDLATEDWNRVIATDLSSIYYMCKAFIPMLTRAPGGGAIVNVASTFGITAHPGMPAYGAAKGGVVALTRQLAVDYGKQGVRVNSLCPGATLSPRVKGYMDKGLVDAEATKALAVFDRLAECDEIADAAAFLASDAASFVHGTALVVDGGQTIK